MIIDKYRAEDRAEVDALFRRVFGPASADASAARWDWQYRRNPNAPEPQIWIARDDGRIVGQYATMPVRLWVNGREIDASWGMDVMVAPERQRRGLGEMLFRTWDDHTGASLGMGLSTGSHQLFRKLKWPEVGPVPCLVKPISARGFTRNRWPGFVNFFVSLATRPVVAFLRDRTPPHPDVKVVRDFDPRFTDLWERIAPRFSFAVRRDVPYLHWKYVELTHVQYTILAIDRGTTIEGYAVFRHVDEPRGRVTALVDLLVDPDDRQGLRVLLGAVERAARSAGSDKIRAFVMNDAYRREMRSQGYFTVHSTVELVTKINAAPIPADFYEHTGTWHVTFGDSDQDR